MNYLVRMTENEEYSTHKLQRLNVWGKGLEVDVNTAKAMFGEVSCTMVESTVHV
jgi:hypothetical protein